MANITERAQLRSARLFAAGLHQPSSPSICPVCFVLFANQIEPSSPLTRLLQADAHAFWNAMMAFVAYDWTRERQDAVSNSLGRVNLRCAKCKPAGHIGRGRHVVGDGDSWFGQVFRAACSALRAGTLNRLARRAGLSSKLGRWPTNSEDLFPYGPARTLDALVSQLEGFYVAGAVLANLVAIQRSVAFPLLSKAVHRSRIITFAIRHLMRCNAAIDADLDRIQQPVTQSTQREVARRHVQLCKGAAFLLYIVGFGPGHEQSVTREFFIFHVQELFQALHPIVRLLYEDENYGYMTTLATHFWVWLSDSDRVAFGCPGQPVYGREIDSSECLKDPYWALRYYLSLRPTRDRCNGPGCGKLVSDKTAADTFSLCGRCRAMMYCSKECQKADWKRTPFPHKEVCDMLQELYTFVPMNFSMMTSDEFSNACRAHTFPLKRVDYLIRWATDGKVQSDYAGGMQIYITPRKFEPQVHLLEIPDGDDDEPRGPVFAVHIPPAADGQVLSQSEFYDGMLKVQEHLAAQGLNIALGFV